MLGDIGLFICLGLFCVNAMRLSRIHKRVVMIGLIFIYAFILGCLHGNTFSYIFRDIKCFLYFFVSYVFCSSQRGNRENVKCIAWAFIAVAIFTTVTNFNSFLTVGLSNLESGKVDREFGLGLGAYYIADVFVLLYIARQEILRFIPKILYYSLQILMLFTCIVSYTRTVWIELVIIFALAVIVMFFYGEQSSIKKLLSTLGIIAVICIVVGYLLQSDNQVIQLIVGRFTGISSAVTDDSSTLAYRIEDVKHNSALYESPFIIIGYGFGQLFQGINGTVSSSPENSFLYYSVKYGIIGCIYLLFKVSKKLRALIRTRNAFNMEMVIILIVHMAIAAMSGNMNKYYSLPFIAGALVLDFTTLFKKNNGD